MAELGYITETQAERLGTSIKESKAIPGYKIKGKLGAGAVFAFWRQERIHDM